MTISDSITQTFTPGRIWIYSDGSAATHGQRTGSYAAVIYPGDGKPFEFILGTSSSTKIGRMEITAVTQALYHVREFVLGGVCMGQEIQIITDSEYVVLGATNPPSRKRNRDLWQAFDELSRGLSISIDHSGRNTEPPQNLCDVMCHQVRSRFERLLASAMVHPDFLAMTLTRETPIPDEPV